MKKLFISLIICLSSMSFAQQSLTWNEVKGNANKGAFPVIETTEKTLCLEDKVLGRMSFSKSDFRIIDKNSFSESDPISLDLEYEGNALEFYQFIDFLDEIHIISYYYNSSKKSYFFLLQKLNDDGSFEAPVVLGETEKNTGNFKGKLANMMRDKLFVARQIRAAVSNNKEHFAFIVPSNLNFTDNETTSWKVITLDREGNRAELEFEEENTNSFYNGLSISNEGEVFGVEMTNLRYHSMPNQMISVPDLLFTRNLNEFYASTVNAVHFNFVQNELDILEVVDNSEAYYNVKTKIKNGLFYVYGIGESTNDFVLVQYLNIAFDTQRFSNKYSTLTDISKKDLENNKKVLGEDLEKLAFRKNRYHLLSELLLDNDGVVYFTVQPFLMRVHQSSGTTTQGSTLTYGTNATTGVGANSNFQYRFKDIFVFTIKGGTSNMSKIEAFKQLNNSNLEGYHAFGKVGGVPTVFYLNEGKYVEDNGASIAGRGNQDSFQMVSISNKGELTFEEIISGGDKTLSKLYVHSTFFEEDEVVLYGVAKKKRRGTLYTKF